VKIATGLLVFGLAAACTGRSKQQATTIPAPAPKPQTGPESQDPGQTGTEQTGTTPAGQPETATETDPGIETESENGSTLPESTTTTDSPGTTTTPSTTTTAPPPANNPTGTIEIQGDSIVFQDLKFSIPSGWKLHQDTFTEGTLIMAFTKGSEYFRIYAKQGALPSMQSVFVNGSQVISQERDETIGGRSWKRIDTQKGQVSVAGFALAHNGHAYYGFGRSGSQQSAAAIAAEFLGAMK
jgi:hypothetical protein